MKKLDAQPEIIENLLADRPPDAGVWSTDLPLVGQVFEEKMNIGGGRTTIYSVLITHMRVSSLPKERLNKVQIQAMIKTMDVALVYSDGDTDIKKVDDVLLLLDRASLDVCTFCNGKDAAKKDTDLELLACGLCNKSWHLKCLSEQSQQAHRDDPTSLLLCGVCNDCAFISKCYKGPSASAPCSSAGAP